MGPKQPAAADERPDLRAPADVVRIARRLEDAGFSTWAVGGAVRDALAGRAPGDWDLATAARPRDVQRLFRRTVPVGIDHGTVGVLGEDGEMYEVTTFRRDVETDGRHAVVRFSDTVEDDLQRRDFTINAVAWHPLTHELRDPHGGAADLVEGVLRTVGEARERFREDRLRVLRALRFAGRFGLRVDDATWAAAREAAPELPHLSAERVREELLKSFAEVAEASRTLRLYAECGVLASLYPELQACVGFDDGRGELWTHLVRTVDQVPRHRVGLRVAALLHDLGKPRVEAMGGGRFPGHASVGAALSHRLLKRLKFPNRTIDRTIHLVAQHSDVPRMGATHAEVRFWLRRVGRDYVWDLLRLRVADLRARDRVSEDELRAVVELRRRARAELSGGVALEVSDLAIGGAELRMLGIPPGPRYSELLHALLDEVTEDPGLNTRAALMDRVRARLESAE